MFIATYETPNADHKFIAYGVTYYEAYREMWRQLQQHGIEYNLPADWMKNSAGVIEVRRDT